VKTLAVALLALNLIMTDSELQGRLRAARLYVVAGDAEPGTQARILCAAVDGGADVVQLRNKHALPTDLLQAAVSIRAYARRHGALFIVNDHLDLAIQSGADGLHLGQDDLSLPAAHAGWEGIVGRSTHSLDQAIEAEAQGADYLGVGPVFATPTKPGRAPVGLELLPLVGPRLKIPWFAIGGIAETNVESVLAAGAMRLAVVRAVCDAPDPRAAARALRARLTQPAGAPA
jgi:thiamine-phosphate pyrophosphorylase